MSLTPTTLNVPWLRQIAYTPTPYLYCVPNDTTIDRQRFSPSAVHA